MATTPTESFSLLNGETVHVQRIFGDFKLCCMIYERENEFYPPFYFFYIIFNSSQYHSCKSGKKKELNSFHVC